MKAIKIDATNKTIAEVDIPNENSLRGWYKEIGCMRVEAVPVHIKTRGAKSDILMVDEEGRVNGKEPKEFIFVGCSAYIAGNALVVGNNNRTGDSIDSLSTLEEIKSRVRFPKFSQF